MWSVRTAIDWSIDQLVDWWAQSLFSLLYLVTINQSIDQSTTLSINQSISFVKIPSLGMKWSTNQSTKQSTTNFLPVDHVCSEWLVSSTHWINWSIDRSKSLRYHTTKPGQLDCAPFRHSINQSINHSINVFRMTEIISIDRSVSQLISRSVNQNMCSEM